jgi:hypothetical protein
MFYHFMQDPRERLQKYIVKNYWNNINHAPGAQKLFCPKFKETNNAPRNQPFAPFPQTSVPRRRTFAPWNCGLG